MTGVINDMAFYSGGYHGVGGSTDGRSALVGAAAAAPNKLNRFAGGSGALNTWHYARFDGFTTTGRHVVAVSQLFYVASN